MKIEWDEIFYSGKLKEGTTNRELCAIGLLGWANCRVSVTPDKFGHGMYEIGKRLGLPHACEVYVTAYAKENK